MELAYWQSRWETGQTAFDEGRPNDLLVQAKDFLRNGTRALVPLCGRAKDLRYLESLGLDVVGVEGVEMACRQWAESVGRPFTVEERAPFSIFHSGRASVACGDFFSVTPELFGTFDVVYDRAALVALDPKTRERYIDVLRACLRPRGRMVLVTVVYDQSKLDGPPWNIDVDDVKRLFRQGFVIEPLQRREVDRGPKFKDAGVEEVFEQLFLLTRY